MVGYIIAQLSSKSIAFLANSSRRMAMKPSKVLPRLFIGIPFEKKLRIILCDMLRPLKLEWPMKTIKWVPQENYHITLEFLGFTDPKRIPAIKESLKKVIQRFIPFQIEIGGLLFLPSEQSPHVIGIQTFLSEELGKLYASVHGAMLELGFELDERPYLPHITIGRVKHIPLPSRARHRDNRASYTRHEDDKTTKILTSSVKQIALFESIQTPEGSEYKIISMFKI